MGEANRHRIDLGLGLVCLVSCIPFVSALAFHQSLLLVMANLREPKAPAAYCIALPRRAVSPAIGHGP